MKPAAAVTRFIPLECRLALAPRLIAGKCVLDLVIFEDTVVANRDIRRRHHQNAFIECVLYCESGNGHVGKTWIIVPVHKDAIRKSSGVDDRSARSRTD